MAQTLEAVRGAAVIGSHLGLQPGLRSRSLAVIIVNAIARLRHIRLHPFALHHDVAKVHRPAGRIRLGPLPRVENHRGSEGLVAAVEAPVGRAGPAANQQHHVQGVAAGGVLGLPPALLQDRVTSEPVGGLLHVDLVLLEGAAVAAGQVLQVEVDSLAGLHPDGPVAPQGRVGAEVVRGEELAGVALQQLLAAPHGEEGAAVSSPSI